MTTAMKTSVTVKNMVRLARLFEPIQGSATFSDSEHELWALAGLASRKSMLQ